MLRVSIHAGALEARTLNNQLAALDIAYFKKAALADYLAALTLRQDGAMEPAYVRDYPRWSASLWDLVARALTQSLYRADQAPPVGKVDLRCAYATRICATLERASADDRGVQLGTVEIAQLDPKQRTYTAKFTEDIGGERSAQFQYGSKRLNYADLLLRAICWALYGTDVLGPRPKLILPPSMVIDGVDRFHLEALTEPARTGFIRHQTLRAPTAAPEQLPRADEYVQFLMRS
jgi:hypothetical protein